MNPEQKKTELAQRFKMIILLTPFMMVVNAFVEVNPTVQFATFIVILMAGDQILGTRRKKTHAVQEVSPA